MHRKKRILIIDDDIDFVRATSSILNSAGYRVCSCRNVQSVMDSIHKFKPDLIILDIMIQFSASGFYLAQEIRKDPKFARIPILMVTAIHQSLSFRLSPEMNGEFLPVQKVLDKPILPKDLLREVAYLIGNGKQ